MSVGVQIEQGTVIHDGSRRNLLLTMLSENLLTYELMKDAYDWQKGKDWTAGMQALAARGENYRVASKEYPLSGIGAGLLIHYTDQLLMVGKQQGDAVKITAPTGHTESLTELCFPYLGAFREGCEEVGLAKDAVCIPKLEGLPSVVKHYGRSSEENHRNILNETFRNAACDNAKLVHSPRPCRAATLRARKDVCGSPLDQIIVASEYGPSVSNGWFYWDPTRSGVNIMYAVDADPLAVPFSAETKYGTLELDRSQQLYGFKIADLERLEQPGRNTAIKYEYGRDPELVQINTVPGAFLKNVIPFLRGR